MASEKHDGHSRNRYKSIRTAQVFTQKIELSVLKKEKENNHNLTFIIE